MTPVLARAIVAATTSPMLIEKKLGNISLFEKGARSIDILLLEWHETNKRIMHKRTLEGREIATRFLNGRPALTEGDVLYEDEHCLVKVEISPCEVITVRPESGYRLASLCYEIGNKHLPLFMDGEEILIPFDEPLYRLLMAGSYAPVREIRKLLHPLKSTVTPHSHGNSTSLFSRIVKLTTPANNG